MNIVLSGYFGYGNLGDELILASLLDQLKRLSPGAVPIVLSADPEGTRRRLGVAAADRWSPAAVLGALRRSRVLISGGGGLFQDHTGPWTPGYYAGLMILARWMGLTVVGWGQGVGPLRRSVNRCLVRRAVSGASLFMVRDRTPRDVLDAGAKVRVGADLVYALPWTFPAEPPVRGRVAAVIRDPGTREGRVRLELLLDAIARRTGRKFKFMAFQEGPDSRLVRRLSARSSGSPAVTLGSPDRMALREAFTDTAAVLSMRYHGLVLASLFGRPGIALAGGPKIDAFVRSFGQTSVADLEPDPASRLVEKVLRSPAVFARRMSQGAAQARQSLRREEELLRRVLAA